MSDFSDRPFVAGSLTGVRVFDVDSLGRLRGVTVPAIFPPGENVAECRKSAVPSMAGWFSSLTFTMTPGPFTPPETEKAETEKASNPPHTVAGVDCSCGFYAYYDQGSNPHDGPGKVTALIQGYGVCSVGLRGFRAEKARLLALVIPEPRRKRHPAWFDRLSDWCRHHDASLPGVASGILGTGATVAAVALAASVALWWLFAVPFALALVAMGVALFKADMHGIDRGHPTISDLTRCYDRQPDRTNVRLAYPDVPVYRSLAEATAAHPLTPPPAPTPDDEDFWTRAAS